MRFVVDHLTKMEPDFVCVAGIDTATSQQVRPIQNRRLRLRDCASHGGPYEIGAIVEIQRARARPDPPEVEDHQYMLHDLRRFQRLAADEFWSMLVAMAKERPQDIFGRELQRVRDTCATARGTGMASLGCVWPTAIVDITVHRRHDQFGEHDSVHIELMLGRSRFRFPVNDLRLFQLDDEGVNWRVNRPVFDAAASRVHGNVPLILSVGLSRAWQGRTHDAPRHWLQVNNLHLGDDSLWSEVPGSRLRQQM